MKATLGRQLLQAIPSAVDTNTWARRASGTVLAQPAVQCDLTGERSAGFRAVTMNAPLAESRQRAICTSRLPNQSGRVPRGTR